MPHSFRLRISAMHVATAVVISSLAGCTDDPEVALPPHPTTPEQNKRETFFWHDRLCIPPFEEPVSADAEAWIAKILAVPVERGANALDQADAVAAVGAPIDALDAALQRTEDPALKIAIVSAAGRRGVEATPLLCRALRQTPTEVCLLAARALGRIDAPWTLPRLVKEVGLYTPHPELIVRVEAAAALLRRKNYATIPNLLRVLKEHTRLQDDREREWPARTRIAFEKEEAWRALAPILGEGLQFSPNAPYDQQADVVVELERRFQERRKKLWADSPALEDPGILAVIDRLVGGFLYFQIRNVDNARYVLSALGPNAIPRLVEHLSDPQVYVRVHVLEVLQQLAVDDDRSAVLEAAARERLADEAPAVRVEATRLLGALDSESAPGAILKMIEDHDASVRLAAIQALGEAGDPAGDTRLQEIATDAPGDEWAAANAALYRRGQLDRVDRLLDALEQSGSLAVRAAALDALLWLGAETATFPLTGDVKARTEAAKIVRESLPAPPR